MRLDTLRNLPGVRACALVSEDGLPLEMQGELGDVLAAELAALRASSERVGRRLGAGQMTRLAFTSDLIEVVAVFTGSFTLGAALLRGTDTRSAQQALARIAAGLGTPGGLPSPLPTDGAPQNTEGRGTEVRGSTAQDSPVQNSASAERR